MTKKKKVKPRDLYRHQCEATSFEFYLLAFLIGSAVTVRVHMLFSSFTQKAIHSYLK